MPLAQLIKVVLQDAITEIVVFAISAGLLILVFNLQMGVSIVVYPIILTVSVIVVYLFVKTLRISKFFKRLEASEISILDESVDSNVQAKVFSVIGNVHDRHLSEICRLRSQIETRNALFSQFMHGMKSSVAVIELASSKLNDAPNDSLINVRAENLYDSLADIRAENLNDSLADIRAENLNSSLADIKAENKKLKSSLEQVLNILRLDAFVNDYVPEKVNLSEIVQLTINEYKRDFIYAGVYPKLSGKGEVYTDSKWLAFLLGQLISNAIKYSTTGDSITFEITKQDAVQVKIEDTGVGIPAEDLPRIYDMFYTGVNGRKRKDSTGIGMFMVKQIADKLGIKIFIDSEVGRGTVIILSFANTQ